MPLFVSEKFKKLIEEKQITGIKLTEIDVDASESWSRLKEMYRFSRKNRACKESS